jgi:integrase
MHLDAKKLKATGTDPAQSKRIAKLNKATANANTFEAVAREWHANKIESWQARTAENVLHRLVKDVFPLIGKLPIADIRAPVMLDVLRQIEKRGALDMARRQSQVCGQIFRYAIASGKAEIDPVPSLRGALKSIAKGHHAAITPDDLPEFIRAFEKIEGRMFVPTKVMFRLMMMIFVRTSELTETPWSEIDLENESWVIDWHRMKMGKKKLNPRKLNHHVFLPRQGWELLRELHTITGRNKYLFPNQRDHEKPATNFGILAALKRMGYSGKMTGHGFRSLAMGVIKERLAVLVCFVITINARADSNISGEYLIRSVSGTSLDFRKIYLIFGNSGVQGFFDNPFTRPASNGHDFDPTCRFFLTGKVIDENELKLETWFPEKETEHIFRGSAIALKKMGSGWVVSIDGALPNCEVATIDNGDEIVFSSPRKWVGFSYVNKVRANLYAKPEVKSRIRSYLVEFDAVAVMETGAEWSKIDYFLNGRDLIKWIPTSDLKTL